MRSRLNGFDDDLFAREADLAAMDIERNAEDTANFIAFLCGNGLASVTGQIFHIDSRIN
jgi:enoyl-[acyl-carrier-protein] reductase (NADH)